jgi:hypothetical protein
MLHSLEAMETRIADDHLRIDGFALSLIVVPRAWHMDRLSSLPDL